MQKTVPAGKAYHEMFEHTNDPLLLFKGDELIRWNRKACALFDMDIDHASVNDFDHIVDIVKKSSVLKHVLNKNSKNATLKREFELPRRNGNILNVEVSLLKIDISGEELVQCSVKDISFLRNTAENDNYTEAKFKKIFNSVTDGILILSLQGEIIEVNELALNRSGYSREEFMKLGAGYFLKDDPLLTVPVLIKQLNEREFTSFVISYTTTYGFKVPIEVYAKKIKYENNDAVIIVTRDISERLLMEKKIFEVEITAQEKERQRVARELHDGISPILSTVKLYAQSLQQDLDKDIREKILLKMTKAIDESIQAVSDISNNLSPHILRHFGLITAVKSFIDKIKENISINIGFDYNNDVRIGINKETYIYRIITELLNNSIKHSSAKNIHIQIEINEENILITYSDDGKGFDFESAVNKSKGMGLKNMLNRIKALNGTINFNRRKKGVLYDLGLPLGGFNTEKMNF